MEVMGGIGVRGGGDSGVGVAGWDPTEVLYQENIFYFQAEIARCVKSLLEPSS